MILRSLFVRFQRIGLQWRIMLYVTSGLLVFSVIYGLLALQAIQQSTDLTYRERLLLARTIARAIDSYWTHLDTTAPDTIGNWLESTLSLGGGDYVIEIIDRSGLIIASKPKSTRTASPQHLQLVSELWREGQSGARTHTLQINGQTHGHVIAFVPLTQIQWGVIVEQEVDEAFELPRTLQMQFIVFGLLALLGGLVLAWVTTRPIVHPIKAFIHASQEVARGNLEHPLDVSGEGEIAILARSFADMRVKLKQSREEIARWNRELETRVELRTRELMALVESSHALTSTLELDELFKILMKSTREVLPLAEGVALFLFEPESQTLVVRSSFGLNATEARQLRFRLGEAIAGRVVEAQAPLLLQSAADVRSHQANFSASNRIHFWHAIGDCLTQSALGVPLLAKGVRLGALLLYNFSREGAFTANDVPILQALANQSATALDNARLFKEASEVGALRELNRLKSEFVARASHELRTPLTSIKSLAETLLRPDLPLDADTQREFLRGIDSAADRLSSIVNDLLMLTRIEAGKLEVQREPVELSLLSRKVVAQFAAQFPSHHFQVTLLDELPHALGDVERIEDVLSNLLSNAVKYSQAGTNVVVSAQTSRGDHQLKHEIIVSVTDKGIGIPREAWPHLFERFYRVDNATTRRVSGAGLGLFICKTFVEAMEGRIWVESQNGHGTTFSFALPLAQGVNNG
jgi:signal transduction histidine kinase/HAMP domain-containing protein